MKVKCDVSSDWYNGSLDKSLGLGMFVMRVPHTCGSVQVIILNSALDDSKYEDLKSRRQLP